jgi:hypothetical protein
MGLITITQELGEKFHRCENFSAGNPIGASVPEEDWGRIQRRRKN